MYQNLSTTSEAEIAFRQAIDSVGDAEQREQLRQAYIQVETQARTKSWYSFARNDIKEFLSTAIKLGQTALVKFFFTKYDWGRRFGMAPDILRDAVINGNLELLNWLLNDSPVRVRCSFYDIINTAITNAQLAVIKYFYETYKQEWQADYGKHGDDWLIIAAKVGQLEILRFLLTRDDAEQRMSKMSFWVFFDLESEVRSKAFVGIIKAIAQACIEINNKKLFDLFIGKVQEYIAGRSQEYPELQALVQQAQERFVVSIELSKLQHQKTDMTDTVTKQQKHQYEQAKKCMQLEQKIVQQAPVAGLINAISEILETKIATYNPAKK